MWADVGWASPRQKRQFNFSFSFCDGEWTVTDWVALLGFNSSGISKTSSQPLSRSSLPTHLILNASSFCILVMALAMSIPIGHLHRARLLSSAVLYHDQVVYSSSFNETRKIVGIKIPEPRGIM